MAEATIGGFVQGCTDCKTRFGIFPIFEGQVRQYLNFNRRRSKGKRIDGNSGNYLGLTAKYQSGKALVGNTDLDSGTLGLGPVYGLQRTYPKGFNFRLEAGMGYFQSGSVKALAPILSAKIGWVLWKSK